ncbi:MAG TPA: DUF1499 domain-containing protein [Rhizomicrobium sp.]|nr:DUF1499 domain-containing protein [Rhizomicrobium sp.]
MRFLPVLAKLAFAALAIALAVGGTAALGTRLGAWDPYNGLWRIFPWAVLAGAASFIFAFVWALLALFLNYGRGARYGALALVGSIAFLYVPINGIVMLRTMPPIHDISTDVGNAPQFSALLELRKSADTPAGYEGPLTLNFDGKRTTISALQKKYYGFIRPIAILTKVPVLYWRAFFAMKRMGWHLVAFDPAKGIIECTDTSFWFGLTDDIVIRVLPSGEGARLDVRSKSRLAGPDMGVNAFRIKAYVKELARK